MKKIYVISIALVLAAAGAWHVVSSEPTEQTRTSVTLATHNIPLAAPYILGKEKGFFEKQGLDVEMAYFTTGLETLHALTGNKAQFASTGATPFVHFSFQRDDARIINQVTLADDFQIIARTDSGIAELKDLEHKKIGFVKGTITQLAVINALRNAGIEPGTYELVEFNQPLALPSALQSKELDAFCAWEPFISNTEEMLGADHVVVFGKEKGLHPLPYLTVVRSDADGDAVSVDMHVAFQKALLDAVQYIHEHPDESIEIVSRVTGMDGEQLKRTWNKYAFNVTLNDELQAELQLEKEWFDTNHEHDLDYADAIDPESLTQANEQRSRP